MRKAALAFAHAVERLAWSSAPLTSYEHSKAASIKWGLRIPPPEVCVDVEAWVKSGYQILSATTKSLADEDAKYNEAFALAVERGHVSVSRFENRSDRTLSKAIVALGQQTLRSRERIRSLEAKVAGKLDLLSREEAAILDIRPQARSVVIHRGSTAAGARYAVRVLPKRSSDDDLGQACAVTLETQESSSGRHAGNSALSNICLSRSHLQPPTVRCIRGLLEVTSQVPPRTRSVSLRLSNGHQIVSRVAIVPAKLGGPLGFYFQMVPGPSPIPVSLTELDGQGRAIGTVGLSSKAGCVAPKPHLKALELSRRLAQGVTPGGLSFLLLGELSGRGRLQEADIELQAPGRRRLLIASQSLSEESLRVPRTIGKASKPLFWEVATGCQPNQYAILYGVSTDPADTVLARTSEGLVALRKVKIPRALHIPGVLAYASFNGVPSEVVVKTPAGATIVHESLALRVDETREFCEGQAEP